MSVLDGACSSNSAHVIAARYLDDAHLLRRLQASFDCSGYAQLPGFLRSEVFVAVSAEVRRMCAARVRKDFVMPGFMTDRKMSVLSGRDVVQQSDVIAKFYADQGLRAWISSFVGTEVKTALHDDEFLVINCLDGELDTHGWHLDDPRYALIVVVESPLDPRDGRLEYIPHWKRLATEHGFDPLHDVLQGVDICRRSGRCRSERLEAGDCYLLDAGEVLHRVSPMSSNGSRKALNLAFDDRRYRLYGESAATLYA